MTRIITETRYDRLMQARQATAARWIGWRVFAVEIQEGPDDLARVLAYCEPLTAPSSITHVFEFLTDAEGKRRSPRFDAFLAACGVTERVDEVREVEGRYFAARNEGRNSVDFESLALALQAAA